MIVNAFEKFWEVYPRKVGKPKAKEKFIKLFEKKNKERANELFKKMLIAIEEQDKTKQWAETQFIPHPTTWLNQERWEDRLNPDEFDKKLF